MNHGRTAYLKNVCRCEVCTAAQRDYMRFWRQSKLTGDLPTSKTAYSRALKRLVDRHVEEFRRLVNDEVATEMSQQT